MISDNNAHNYLVIGGDGMLGQKIAESLRSMKRPVITTSRRTENLSASNLFLDLNDDLKSWLVPAQTKIAFLCAAVTSLEECRNNPDGSRKINVDSTLVLSKKLLREGISIVYPSTNLVYDGLIAFQKAESKTCPRTEYGRQKAIVEERLLKLGNVSIVRFTKILDSRSHLINQWATDLKNDIKIYPFMDMPLSPVTIDFAAQMAIEIAESASYGLWQVSGSRDITYGQMALVISEKIGSDQKLVCPIKVKESGMVFEAIPKYSTLDTSRIKNELGFNAPDVWHSVKTIIDEIM